MGMRIEGGPEIDRKGSVNSSAAVALAFGSLTSIRSRNLRNRDDTEKP